MSPRKFTAIRGWPLLVSRAWISLAGKATPRLVVRRTASSWGSPKRPTGKRSGCSRSSRCTAWKNSKPHGSAKSRASNSRASGDVAASAAATGAFAPSSTGTKGAYGGATIAAASSPLSPAMPEVLPSSAAFER